MFKKYKSNLSAIVVILAVSCGKKLGKENANNLGSPQPSELTISSPLPTEDNLSSSKDEVNNMIVGLDYSNRCGDDGVSCNGLWALKQSRCNDEPVSGSFANEPVFINIKDETAQLQFENGSIENLSLRFDEPNTDLMTFTKDGNIFSQKSYNVATEDGVMNVYLSGSDAKCPSGTRTAVYTRLSSDAIASLFKKADEIAAAKKEEEECIAAGKAHDAENQDDLIVDAK